MRAMRKEFSLFKGNDGMSLKKGYNCLVFFYYGAAMPRYCVAVLSNKFCILNMMAKSRMVLLLKIFCILNMMGNKSHGTTFGDILYFEYDGQQVAWYYS